MHTYTHSEHNYIDQPIQVSIFGSRGGRHSGTSAIHSQPKQATYIRTYIHTYTYAYIGNPNYLSVCSESEGFSIAPQFRSMIVKNLIAATSYQVRFKGPHTYIHTYIHAFKHSLLLVFDSFEFVPRTIWD